MNNEQPPPPVFSRGGQRQVQMDSPVTLQRWARTQKLPTCRLKSLNKVNTYSMPKILIFVVRKSASAQLRVFAVSVNRRACAGNGGSAI